MKSGMKDTLLLIGSSDSDRAELHEIFDSQYYLLEAENAMQGSLLLMQSGQCIAAVIADVPLTEEESIRELIKASNPGQESEIPVILLVSPVGTGQQEERAFLLGATDVVLKPYARLSIQRRVQVLVDLYLHRWRLESLVENQHQAIRGTYQTILDAMSSIIEHRSVDSGNHALRLRGFSRILLQEVAKAYPEYGLTPESIESISAATTLHDVGKIVIPDAILNKPGPLKPEEFEIMKTHTTLGGELIAKLNGAGEALYLKYAYNICLYHHERWDGKGYPYGLKGEEIPICAQVAGITDAFDALTTKRVYKPAFSCQTAVNMILNGECGAFSPQLLECFKRTHRKLAQLARQHADGKKSDSETIKIPLSGPEQSTYSLDATQSIQLKYQALLHYFNDTVIELDLDNHIYHVVNNPNPDFVQIIGNEDLGNNFQSLLKTGLHPEDSQMVESRQQMLIQKLFVERQRQFSIRCRVFNPLYNQYDPYEITMIRINIPNSAQRMALALFHNLDSDRGVSQKNNHHFSGASEWQAFMHNGLCCGINDDLSVVEGGNVLQHLTGYTPWELKEKFGNALINLVDPEDREKLLAAVRKCEESTNWQEEQFRLCHRSGKTVWVLAKCRIYVEDDGAQNIYCALTDISSVRIAQQELSRDYIRHQVIVNQFKNIILEWNLVTDELTCSDQWKERFGFEINAKEFSRVYNSVSFVHPDDLPELVSRIKHLREQEAKELMDLRIADIEGRYTWSRVRAVSLAEGQEKPTCIIAVVYNIDDLKKDAIEQKQKAERDTLTKLLNKMSTTQAVTEYLENRRPDSLAALLVLDVDNFKMVNDNYGHLYGDAILMQIGENLRNLFRSRDIIGRIGGDEFLILLKDLPNVEIVHDRCQLLVRAFQEQLHQLMPKIPVSITVGGALAPFHGSTWMELFQHADEALYSAKNMGKCQYKIYNAKDTYQTLVDQAMHTRIDSDEQPSLNEDALIRQVFHNLYASKDLEASINEVLAFVGAYFNVSRVYIFENTNDNTCCKNTFEWCNVGITPQIEMLQEVNYDRDVPNWRGSFNENGIFYSSNISELPQDLRDILEPQGIKSLLHCAIMDRGEFRGVVGFDECNTGYLWTQKQISLLQFLAELLSVFLLKQRRAEDPLHG